MRFRACSLQSAQKRNGAVPRPERQRGERSLRDCESRGIRWRSSIIACLHWIRIGVLFFDRHELDYAAPPRTLRALLPVGQEVISFQICRRLLVRLRPREEQRAAAVEWSIIEGELGRGGRVRGGCSGGGAASSIGSRSLHSSRSIARSPAAAERRHRLHPSPSSWDRIYCGCGTITTTFDVSAHH